MCAALCVVRCALRALVDSNTTLVRRAARTRTSDATKVRRALWTRIISATAVGALHARRSIMLSWKNRSALRAAILLFICTLKTALRASRGETALYLYLEKIVPRFALRNCSLFLPWKNRSALRAEKRILYFLIPQRWAPWAEINGTSKVGALHGQKSILQRECAEPRARGHLMCARLIRDKIKNAAGDLALEFG